jgi:hypothetical protein
MKTGGLTLEQVALDNVTASAETLEKVVLKLRTGQMPPPSAARPDGPAIEQFAGSLERALDQAAAALPNPGRPVVHRLNRTEYANAIRDLLALDIDARSMLSRSTIPIQTASTTTPTSFRFHRCCSSDICRLPTRLPARRSARADGRRSTSTMCRSSWRRTSD